MGNPLSLMYLLYYLLRETTCFNERENEIKCVTGSKIFYLTFYLKLHASYVKQ